MFKKNEMVLVYFEPNLVLGIVIKQVYHFYIVNILGDYGNCYVTKRLMRKITSKIKIKEVNGGQIICG
jgi:hypothetical protein